jgi:hypothetical protein
MKEIKKGLVFGFIFALVDALMMVPLDMSDKTLAILGASINRFAIGFLIPVVNLPFAPWLTGLLVGILLSLPDAIITKTYIPIVGIGAVGGLIIGLFSGKDMRSLRN